MLRVSELYTSTQGEGPRTGTMTQFLRFAGCNMRCAGWPCDTPYAIFPDLWKTDSERIGVGDLVERIKVNRKASGASVVCLTGGEPFLQKNDDLQMLVAYLDRLDFTVECFSNGSFVYPDWAVGKIHFIMDWKLEGSGEGRTALEERVKNAKQLSIGDCIKFVVTDQKDLIEARTVWEHLHKELAVDFWVGAAWGHIEDTEIIEFIKKFALPWKLNVQVHKHIWKPDERGV